MSQGVCRAVKEIRWIVPFLLVASGAVIKHLRSAVGTINKTSKRIRNTKSINTFRRFPQLLRKLPRFTVNDCFVGVLENQPILFWILDRAFVFVGFLMRTEVDGIAAIFLLGYNISDDITAPTIWVRKFLFTFPYTDSSFGKINGGRFNLVVKKNTSANGIYR